MSIFKNQKPVEIKPIYPADYINTAGYHNLQQTAPEMQCPFRFCIHHRSTGLNGSQTGVPECFQCTMIPSGFVLDEDKKARYEQNIIDCRNSLTAEAIRQDEARLKDYNDAQDAKKSVFENQIEAYLKEREAKGNKTVLTDT